MAGAFQSNAFQSDAFQEDTGTSATTTDAPATSDSVTRTVAAIRSVTAAPTTADVATRGAVLSRTATESINTSDAVNAATGALSRTATDAPTTSDAATRALVLSRATSDAPTANTAATRTLAATRSATDAPTTADTSARSFALVRSTTETFSSADVATRARNLGRITSDSVTTSISATRSAVLSRHLTQSAVAGDVALSVPQPYLPGPAIYIDGTNITKADGDPVLFATARFMSAVNGVAGEAHFRVRDDLGTTNYLPGQALQLIIDGQPAWTGFVTNVKRVYVFPALNVDDFGPTRFFDIDGTDLNILFSRRIVFDQSHPANILAPLYATFTPDVTVISDLIAGWLDLSGDALDTSTDVHHVGAINEDQLARAWEGSDTWGQAMQSITALPASIYYIRPNREFAYVDTDTPDAPFGLSDVPDGVTSKGYREMEVLFDGTNLANDVLAWGAGYGSNAPVFTRAQDATSESTHGRWQLGQTTFGVYRQATINRIADSILNGSPDHHRGAKDDRKAVTVTTYEPGLLPAQKVPFESAVFGYSEVLPIRKMEITFPTPTTPKYELTLSQEIDVPWSFFDPFRLKLPGLPGVPTITIPPLPTPGGCVCGITDSFNRTVVSGFGTSDSGIDWTGFAAASVSGGEGHISVAGNGFYQLPFAAPLATVEMTARTSGAVAGDVAFLFVGTDGDDSPVEVDFYQTGHVDFFSDSGTASTDLAFGCNTAFRARIAYTSSTTADLYLWDASGAVPGSPTLSITSGTSFGALMTSAGVGGSGGTFDFYIDDLLVAGVDKCSEFRFDNFNRVVVNGWGTSDYGAAWIDVSSGGGFGGLSVGGGIGSLLTTGGTPNSAAAEVAGVPPFDGTFTMTGLFHYSTVPSFPGGNITLALGTTGIRARLTINDDISANIDLRGPHTDEFAPFAWDVTGRWYYVKWTHTPNVTSKLKVWLVGSAEPGAWQVERDASTDGQSGTPPFDVINNGPVAGNWTIQFDYIDFDYTGKPCFAGGSPPGTGLPFYGPVCEDATRIDSTHYQLSRAVVSGSEQVYEAGYLLLPGIGRDYGISIDTGLITFADTVADGTRIYVCYTATGPLA